VIDWEEARQVLLWRTDVLTAIVRLDAEAGDRQAVKRLERLRALRQQVTGEPVPSEDPPAA
jgi:hypothetical protein